METSETVIEANADRGFTLVEVLIVITILGILSVVTVFAVRGITDRGERASCQTDARVVGQAAEIYMVDRNVDLIPPTGDASDPDRYEQTLVDGGFLREVSDLYSLDADGTVIVEDEICN